MELVSNPDGEDGPERLGADVPLRVVIAFDQLTDDEKRAVLAALRILEREGLQATSASVDMQRLAGSEQLYALRAAPDVRVLVRAPMNGHIEVVDIIRPAALRNFAHAVG